MGTASAGVDCASCDWRDLGNEDGPNGGDEINILCPARIMAARCQQRSLYAGPRVTEKSWQDGMENPLVFWVPSIAISG